MTDITDPADEEARGLADRHSHHGFGQYDFCPRCRGERDQLAADREAEHAARIVSLNAQLRASVTAAQQAVFEGIRAITELAGNAVYDIEFSEGWEGDDVKADLQAAAKALRNVNRICTARAALLKAEGGAPCTS